MNDQRTCVISSVIAVFGVLVFFVLYAVVMEDRELERDKENQQRAAQILLQKCMEGEHPSGQCEVVLERSLEQPE